MSATIVVDLKKIGFKAAVVYGRDANGNYVPVLVDSTGAVEGTE